MAHLSAAARWWLNAWPHRLYIRRSVPSFLQACPQPFRGQVLEVGAGTGLTSRTILETYPQVELTATDLDERALNTFGRLQDQYGRRLRVQSADVEELPFDRASFDVVVAFFMMRYVDDPQRAIQQCIRVLRPGGLLGIMDTAHPATDIAELIGDEAKILERKGTRRYFVWAQKAYPY